MGEKVEPVRAQVMSRQDVEVVQSMYEDYARGDYEAALGHFDEDVEWCVWTVRAGKIVRQRMFRDRDQALEAAGLEA